MSLNAVFVLASILALCGWVVLLASVFRNIKVPGIAARIIPMVLAVLYSVLMVVMLPFKGGDFASLAGIAKLFSQPQIALIGWIHYLAFDLFIGAWQVQTAKRQQLSKMLVVPSLLLTLILGPAGLLLFLSARYFILKRRDAT